MLSVIYSSKVSIDLLNSSEIQIATWCVFSCCGVDSYNDFTGGVKWNTNYGGGLKAPITCCVTIPDSTTPTCAVTPSDIYTKLVLIIFALIIFCDARQSSKVDPEA
uniref:Uncharacterized protein n=1 Tax=Magallana gigas TaxID=29159 RepID=A0A8W8LHW0_MAGGI